MLTVKRIETHQIKRTHELFEFCDQICFKSKNLYNAILYRLRKKYEAREEFSTGQSYVYKEYKNLDEFKALGSAFANLTIKQLSTDYKSFFQAMKAYKKNPDKFNSVPRPPKYKVSGEKGRFIAAFQANLRKDGKISIPKTDLVITPLNADKKIKQVQIEPSHRKYHKNIYYTLNIIYEMEMPEQIEESKRIVGIDLGLNNLATVVNNIGVQPFVVNGKPLKSMNQYFNKEKARLMSYIGGKGTSNRLEKLHKKRRNKIKNYMHNVSHYIVNWCADQEIDTIVIGNNKDWKQCIHLGKKNNQHFVGIPFKMLIEQLQYKAKEKGIKVIVTEESYTSKSSFLDCDILPKLGKQDEAEFSGKRIKRGLYKSKDGTLINADVNGAYNIVRKVFPEAFQADNIHGALLHPNRVNVV